MTVATLSTPVINFTNKDNLYTCEVDMPFWSLFWESEAILSKKFRPGYRDCENIFSPVRPRSRDLGNQARSPSHMNTPKCLQSIQRCAEISQTGLPGRPGSYEDRGRECERKQRTRERSVPQKYFLCRLIP